MELAYFRSPSRRELKDRREKRKEVSRAINSALTQLDSVVHAIQRGDSASATLAAETPVPITTIPSDFIPKRAQPKKVQSHSIVRTLMVNEAYEADLKSRPPTETLPAANGGSKRPLVTQDRPLPLSWDAKGRKNDNQAVASKLLFASGKAEAPPIYTASTDDSNPRKQLAKKREELKSKFVQPSDHKPKVFEYKPQVAKIPIGAVPRVAAIEVERAERPRSAPTLQGKAFR